MTSLMLPLASLGPALLVAGSCHPPCQGKFLFQDSQPCAGSCHEQSGQPEAWDNSSVLGGDG